MLNYVLKHTLVLVAVSISIDLLGQVNYLHQDFETKDSILDWSADQCLMDSFYANPYQDGTNSSQKVLKYEDIGGQYANVRLDLDNPLNLRDNNGFQLLLYIPSNAITGTQKNQISLKLQDGRLQEPWSTQCEIIKAIVTDAWQWVKFDFENDDYINLNSTSPDPITRTDFNRIVFQLNGENNTDKVVGYLDSIQFLKINPPTKDSFPFLVWSDEFNGAGAIDTTKWFHQTILPNGNSWYNGEIQHYTSNVKNSFVKDGLLHIRAIRETYIQENVTKSFTSARLNSKFAFTEGRVEIRAILPAGAGTWPAFWTLGQNIIEKGAYWDLQGYGQKTWPACGEIDIMEHWGNNQNFVQSAMHTPSSFGGTINKGGQFIPTVSNQFHVYALEWTQDKMLFSVDNKVHYLYNPLIKDQNTWPFTGPQYLLLNLAILPNIASNISQADMLIDYVRVYQKTPSATHISKTEEGIFYTIYPNPVIENKFYIGGLELEDISSCKVYSLSGQEQNIELSKNGNKLKVSFTKDHLEPGIYLLKLQTNKGSKTLKFIKY